MDRALEMSVLVAVAQRGGISAAADQLKLTPSAVSKVLNRLEDRLGVKLLTRTTRHVSLTIEGKLFEEQARRILADMTAAEEAVSQGAQEPRGLLKVNCSTVFGQLQLVPLLGEMMAVYPKLEIELTTTDAVIDIIETGADVAIRIGKLPDSSLIAKKLADIHRLIVAAPSYLKRHPPLRAPEDLIDHQCLFIAGRSSINEWRFEQNNGTARSIPVTGRFVTNDAGALRRAALNGLGIARIASFAVMRDVRDGRLVSLLEDYRQLDDAGIYVVYPPSRHQSPRVRAFVDFMTKRLIPMPPWL